MRDSRRRLDDLLLARATARPSPAEADELARLLAAHPVVDPDVYERAAAAVCLATLDTTKAMPPALYSKLELAAAAFVASALPTRR